MGTPAPPLPAPASRPRSRRRPPPTQPRQGFNSAREEATLPSPGTASPPRHRSHSRARSPSQAHRCSAAVHPPTDPAAQPRPSPRGPPAHRRLLTQLRSRPLPAATPGAAPPSRQLLLPPLPAPPSRSPPQPGAAAPAQRGSSRDALPERCPGYSRAGKARRAGREGGREGEGSGDWRRWPRPRPARVRGARAGRRAGPGAPDGPRWRLRRWGRGRERVSHPRVLPEVRGETRPAIVFQFSFRDIWPCTLAFLEMPVEQHWRSVTWEPNPAQVFIHLRAAFGFPAACKGPV
ncbi:translation initiation factor IF-2-like [Passer montanus]|uniref:translation initiation factor IF-2-like n=1 Tax=Passer montanus TaxID=9160 RepID=UPI0019612130|nr:translation initiation factor IF-2-like [Passer montanus]